MAFLTSAASSPSFTARILKRTLFLASGLAALLGHPSASPAATVLKNGTANITQTATDWVDGGNAPTAPTSADVGQFGNGVPTTLTLAEDVSLLGLNFAAVTTPSTFVINDGGSKVLTLGTSGIVVEAGSHSVTLNHAVALDANQSWTVGAGRALVVNGVISGNFNLALSSAAGDYNAGFRFTGTTANTYTGTTTLSAGALILAKSAGVNAIAGNISATAHGANIILANDEQIANTAIVTLSNGAKLILEGRTETIGGLQATGSTTLVQATESGTNRPSTLILEVSGSDSYHFNGGIVRNGGTTSALSLEKKGTGTQILEGALMHTGTTTISGGTLVIRTTGAAYYNNTRAITHWASAIVNNATLNLQHANTTATAETLSVAISGSGNVIKSGAGTITLGNTGSSFAGITFLEGGILGIAKFADYGANSSLGNRAADAVGDVGIVFRGGTLQYAGATAQTTNRAIRIGTAGGSIDASGSTVDATIKFTAASSPELFEGAGARTFTLTGSNTGRNEFHLQLTDQDVNKTSLTKAGSGTWHIANTNNTYTGTTILQSGILNVASLADYGVASSLGIRQSAEGPMGTDRIGILFRGGTLQYTGSTAQSTNRAIRISTTGGAFIDASGSTVEATLSFTAANSADLYENPGPRQLTLTGSNQGNNTFSLQLTDQNASTGKTTLNKTGAGTWILTNVTGTSSESTYTGDTNILQGILATRGFGIGNGSLVNLADEASATLRLDANETIGALGGGGTTGGRVDLQTFTLTLGSGNRDGTFGGMIVGTGATKADDLIKTGTGTQYLTGTNSTYGGFTVLAQGILNIARIGNLGENSSIGNRAADNAASDVGLIFRGGTLQYTGSTAQSTDRAIRVSTTGGAFIDASGSNIDATLSFTRSSSPDFFEASGNRQVTFTGTNQGNNTFNMGITQTGGTTTVNKTGTGTWKLGGTSTYTGDTNVNAGALLLTGSLASSNVTVASGATLGGTGTAAGQIIINGTLSPGNDAKTNGYGMGTITFTSTVSFAQGSSYFVQLGTNVGGGVGASDRMAAGSGLTLGSDVNLSGVFQGTFDDREDNTRYWIGTNGGTWTINGTFANSEVWDWTGILYTAPEAAFHQGYKVTVDGVDFALFYDANFGSDSLYGGNDIVLIATVPEPLAGTLLLAALGSIILQRRRRPHASG